jgi:hypothetical protein
MDRKMSCGNGVPANEPAFSRQRDRTFSFNHVVNAKVLKTKHNLNRFSRNRQDLWSAFQVKRSEASVEFTLKALDDGRTYDRGTFVGLDGDGVRDLLNTVARYAPPQKFELVPATAGK